MIVIIDEYQRLESGKGLFPLNEPIHKRHDLDGDPVCWDEPLEVGFIGTDLYSEVTCRECLAVIRESG